MSIHSCSLGAPILLEEAEAAGVKPAPKGAAPTPECDRMKALGQCNQAWDPFFELDLVVGGISPDTFADAIKTAKHSELVCALDLTDAALLVYFSCCAKSQVVQMSYANCRRIAFGTILHRSAC
jgi:hypothetical protein